MSTRHALSFLLLALLIGSCAHAPTDCGPIVPYADYHQHLLSPMSAPLASDPPLPTAMLPANLADFLHQHEAHWNEPAALEALYTENAVLFSPDDPGWIGGRQHVTQWIGSRFARPYQITPVAYGVGETGGFVAAYLTRGEGAAMKRFGHIHFSLVKEDNAWKIEAVTPAFGAPPSLTGQTAEDLLKQLDDAGIQHAVVLSLAFWFSDDYDKVRAENDWTAEQAAKAPNRLVAFCSFNPLKDYAVPELERCAKSGRFRGLKLHFGNSHVDLTKPEHVAKMREVFAAANRLHFPIVAHLWTGPDYGAKEAEIFLNQVVPSAPDIPIQIAHFAGGGPGYTDEALAVYANAITKGDPHTKNLYFDVTTVADHQTPETLKMFAQRIRQVGPKRVLFGTDLAPPNPPARQAWLTFRTTVPLTDEEFRVIAGNRMPYWSEPHPQ